MLAKTYQEHPVRPLVKSLIDLADNEHFSNPDIFSPGSEVEAQRDSVFAFARTLAMLLDETPAAYVTTGINSLTSGLQQAMAQMSAFQSQKNPSYIASASQQIDSIAGYITCFLPRTVGNKKGLIDITIAGLQKSAQQAILHVSGKKDELDKQIASFQATISSQEKQIKTLSESVSTQKAEALSVVAQVNKEYAETEQKRTELFTKTIQGYEENYRGFSSGTADDAEKLLEQITKKRDEAKDLLQVVGAIALTGNYKKVAVDEEKQANLWRLVTTGFFGAGVLLALCSVVFAFVMRWIHPTLPVSDVYIDLLMRLLTAIAITTPAWYFAKESARHRTNAERARQREAELTTLGPFIELLPEEKRNEIRASLTPLYFGREREAHSVGAPIDAGALGEKAIEALSKPKN